MQLRNPNGPVIILAGGTGGHIFPGLAVANALKQRGIAVSWIGSEGGMETRLVADQDIAIDTIAIKGIRGKGAFSLLKAPAKILRAIGSARAILKQRRPRAVVSFGGYAAGPGGLAARLTGVPLIVHEQNRAAGLTNRVLSRMSDAILTGFPDTFAGQQETWVGNPVRNAIAEIEDPATRLQNRNGALRLLVLGGSQGAKVLNDSVPHAIQALQAEGIAFEVRHQCGEKMLEQTRANYAQANVTGQVDAFIGDMTQAYARADLIVCRAGALTLAEICAAGVASVLVPFAAAVDDHQTKNAHYLVARGAARIASQTPDLAQKLATHIRDIHDRNTLMDMAVAARSLAKPDAADRVAQIILEKAA